MIARLNSNVQIVPDPESDGALLLNQDSFMVARVNKTGQIILDLAEQHETWDSAADSLARLAGCSAEYATATIREYTDNLASAGCWSRNDPRMAIRTMKSSR